MTKTTTGFHFYAEMPEHRRSKSACREYKAFTRATLREGAALGQLCNCVAVLTGDEHRCPDYSQEALSAVMGTCDSDTNLGSVSRDYLAKRCVRIDADLARKLHPRLLARIDAGN